MKTLLLVAGSSQRFWPLIEKFRLPVAGKTLLEHQIDRLRLSGCADILCVASVHNHKWIRALFPTITTIIQGEERGMRGALLAALPLCGNDPVLIVGNDFIETGAYKELQEKFFSSPHLQGILLAREVTEYFPGGYLTLDQERITTIKEKPGAEREPSNLINIVAHLHRDASLLFRSLSTLPPVGDDGYEQALHSLFQQYHYAALPYRGVWFPLKYPWHPLPILPSLLDNIPMSVHPSVTIHPSAVVEGNVTLEEGVCVFPHATVRGPCFIGKNTIIGNNTLLWGSSIGRSCVIGFGTEVKASILSNHVWTHSTYIGDSVIGENVSFGAGSVVGNFRLDERMVSSIVGQDKVQTGLKKLGTIIGDNCRIGIHVSMNPGVKIGGGSFVSTATVVTQDISDRSFVSTQDGKIIIRKNTSPPPHPQDRLLFRGNLERKSPVPA